MDRRKYEILYFIFYFLAVPPKQDRYDSKLCLIRHHESSNFFLPHEIMVRVHPEKFRNRLSKLLNIMKNKFKIRF